MIQTECPSIPYYKYPYPVNLYLAVFKGFIKSDTGFEPIPNNSHEVIDFAFSNAGISTDSVEYKYVTMWLRDKLPLRVISNECGRSIATIYQNIQKTLYKLKYTKESADLLRYGDIQTGVKA